MILELQEVMDLVQAWQSDDTSVVVGSFLFDAPLENGERAKDSGAAFVYERSNQDDFSWDLINELFSQEIHESEKFGTSVDINTRYLIVGKIVLIQITQVVTCTFMLEILVIENWLFSEILYPENNDVVSGFGSSLALGSNVAIIGASQDKESDLYERSGKVFC